jgi:ribokinase
MKPAQIVVVGSVNTDMVVKAQRIPAVGETVTGGQFVLAAGGKGANQAVAAARLGAQVTLGAKVGQDIFGDQAVENFGREGILTDFVLRDAQSATGVALILVDHEGRNLISVAAGANFALRPRDVDLAAQRIRTADVVLLQLEVPLDTVAYTAELAARAGVRVILDPAPAAPLEDSLLRNIAVPTPNEPEAEQLTGIAVRDEASAHAAAGGLLDRGVGQVLITLGAKGAFWADRHQSRHFPPAKVEAVDSTAAGDAFNGGLAVALAECRPMDEAVRQASLAGALAATRLGAQPSLPTRSELAAFAQSCNPQNT